MPKHLGWLISWLALESTRHGLFTRIHCHPSTVNLRIEFLLGAKKLFKVTSGSSHLRLWSARPQISARSMTAAIRAYSDTTSIHAETLRNGSIRIQGQTQKRGWADQASIFLFSSLFPILCWGNQFNIIIDGKREREWTPTVSGWQSSPTAKDLFHSTESWLSASSTQAN